MQTWGCETDSSVKWICSLVSVGSSWSVSASGSVRNIDETHEADKRYSWSDFASWTDKSDWDTLYLCITNPDLVDFHDYVSLPWSPMLTQQYPSIGRDVISAVSGHVVIDESDEET